MFTKQQLLWANEQRSLFRSGRLTRRQIRLLETIPNWTWEDVPVPEAAEETEAQEPVQPSEEETEKIDWRKYGW